MTSPDKSSLLERLLEVSRQMSETRDLEPLLDYIMTQALEFTKGEHGYLVLLTDDGHLDFRITHGRPFEGNDKQSPVSHSIIRQAIETQKPVLVRDAGQNSQYQTAMSVVRLRLRSVLCVPLIARMEILGVLYLENRRVADAFTVDDIDLMVLLASQAAIAVKNAQLNAQQQFLLESLEEIVEERTRETNRLRYEAERGWEAALEENHLRTALLGNITHDLRSPLNIVINSMEWMKLGEFGDTTPEQAKWIDRSLNATRQVLRLVNDIFDLSKLEQGELELYHEAVYVKQFMEQTFAILEGLHRNEGVELVMQIAENLPPISADVDRIQQILINLLSNAFKFTEKGQVMVRAKQDVNFPNFVLFEVQDTGSGIPAEDLGTIFDRFQQARNNSIENKRGGTGLGLAICKELVHRHNGQIGVESEVGVGTTFYFTIPIAQV